MKLFQVSSAQFWELFFHCGNRGSSIGIWT